MEVCMVNFLIDLSGDDRNNLKYVGRHAMENQLFKLEVVGNSVYIVADTDEVADVIIFLIN
jgi:hypothetical protein